MNTKNSEKICVPEFQVFVNFCSVKIFTSLQTFFDNSNLFMNRWDFIYSFGSQIHDSLVLNIDSGKNIENSRKDATLKKP